MMDKSDKEKCAIHNVSKTFICGVDYGEGKSQGAFTVFKNGKLHWYTSKTWKAKLYLWWCKLLGNIMISNRFKTEEDRKWHTKTQFEAQTSYDKARSKAIKKDYGLECERLSQNVIRISDGNKRLDLYETRYFKVDTGERGNIRDVGEDRLIREYFNLC